MTDTTNKATKKELRDFGLIFSCGMVLIFGLFFPWVLENPWPLWPWIVAGVFTVPALLMPAILAPVHKVWMKIGHILGWINTRIILGLIFFVVFAPVSLLFFILRKDPMNRSLDADLKTYRKNCIKEARERMENPF